MENEIIQNVITYAPMLLIPSIYIFPYTKQSKMILVWYDIIHPDFRPNGKFADPLTCIWPPLPPNNNY